MRTTSLRTVVTTAAAGLAATATWLLGLRAGALAREVISAPRPGVDELVALGVVAAGAAVALWYLATYLLVGVVLVARRAGTTSVTLEAGVRRWGFPGLRRTLLGTTAVGLGLAVGVLPAGATTEPDLPTDLRWGATTASAVPLDDTASHPTGAGPVDGAAPLPTPSPAAEPSATTAPPGPAQTAPPPTTVRGAPVEDDAAGAHRTDPPATPAGTTRPSTAGTAGTAGTAARPSGTAHRTAAAPADGGGAAAGASTVEPAVEGNPAPSEPAGEGVLRTVRAGDTLWAIAAEQLGTGATVADIAAAWPAWHETNRAVIGANPNLIHPGQQLLTPKEAS